MPSGEPGLSGLRLGLRGARRDRAIDSGGRRRRGKRGRKGIAPAKPSWDGLVRGEFHAKVYFGYCFLPRPT